AVPPSTGQSHFQDCIQNVSVSLSTLAPRRARSDASASGSWAANPADPRRGEERVAQRLLGIERLRQRDDDRFGAGAVLLGRAVVLHASSEVGAGGMEAPARGRDLELRDDR